MNDWIVPDWPAPPRVKALVTTRSGGVSRGPFASMNLGDHVEDDPEAVRRNRAILRAQLPAEPKWLKQVHGSRVARVDGALYPKEGDGAVARVPGTVCAVLVADCLPVLLCDERGTTVGIAHAGWRGLATGILGQTVASLGTPPASLLAWFGPAIGPKAFEVGDEVREVFLKQDPRAEGAFQARQSGKWLCDLYALARQRLERLGLTRIHGGGLCTYQDAARFYSYRREPVTGRMAALIWLD
ncbi:MAG TPA: peptidoglycan editing factor PgeF [Burkholderiales bacterium]|nr:peptidoglycan editing factor PgeF [Burkholderiales bacterium]